MIQLILQQEYLAFVLIAFALIFSLTFHEFGYKNLRWIPLLRKHGYKVINPAIKYVTFMQHKIFWGV